MVTVNRVRNGTEGMMEWRCGPDRKRRPFLSACILGLISLVSLARAEPVVIQLKWLHQFQSAGYYAALEQGYFSDEGLDVVLRERDPAADVVDQVLRGEAHYGVADSILFLHQSRGEAVVIVAALFQHAGGAIITMGDSGLTRPRDLIGRRLAFYDNDTDGSDSLAMLADQGILQAGLIRRSWDRRLIDLVRGDVDAVSVYVTNEPYVLREQGYSVNIISPRHYGFDLYGDMLFTSSDEAQNNPRRVEAIRRAVLRGWEYALDHKEEMVDLILQRYNTQQKSRQALLHEAEGIEALVDRYYTPIGSLDEGRVDHIVRQLQRLSLLAPDGGLDTGHLFNASTDYRLRLTEEERRFIAGLGSIRVGVEKIGWPPFEFVDQDGNLQGIASDYLKRLSALLGVRFEIVTFDSWEAILSAARADEIDLLPAAASTPDRRDYLSFTAPYVRSPMVMVARDHVDFIADVSLLAGERVGVVGGYASDEMLSRYYPELNLVRYDSALEGLRAVASGSDQVFIDNLAAASHLIRLHGLANLKIAGQTPYAFDLTIGVRDDWPLLRSAIDKALASLTPQQHAELYSRWVNLPVEQPFPWDRVLPFAAGFALLLALSIAYLLRLRRLNSRVRNVNHSLEVAEQALREKNRQLQALSVTDRLTGVFNRHHLDVVLAEQFEVAWRHQRPLAILLFDLDHFKQVNDRHGHQLGDDVLRRFSALVFGMIRRSDIFGRWGGEEFMLICPETRVSQAAVLAEKIRVQLESMEFPVELVQTVSVGVADMQGINSAEQLVATADSRLYQAKRLGRNRVVASE